MEKTFHLDAFQTDEHLLEGEEVTHQNRVRCNIVITSTRYFYLYYLRWYGAKSKKYFKTIYLAILPSRLHIVQFSWIKQRLRKTSNFKWKTARYGGKKIDLETDRAVDAFYIDMSSKHFLLYYIHLCLLLYMTITRQIYALETYGALFLQKGNQVFWQFLQGTTFDSDIWISHLWSLRLYYLMNKIFRKG
jgi:hypothetical protein